MSDIETKCPYCNSGCNISFCGPVDNLDYWVECDKGDYSGPIRNSEEDAIASHEKISKAIIASGEALLNNKGNKFKFNCKHGTTVDITFESNKFKVFQVSIKITNEHQGVTYNDKEFANNNNYEEAINKIDVDILYKYNEALIAIENIRPISMKYQSGKYSCIHPAAVELEQKVTEKKWIEALKRINYYNTLVSGWEESRNAVLKYIGENA